MNYVKTFEQFINEKYGKTIHLTPTDEFGSNKKRLTKFYKRFGFVANRGENKDFTIKDTMIRYPKDLNEKVYTGKWVADHIKDITPNKEDIPTFFINSYVKPNKWVIKKIDLKKLLKTDKDFKEYFDSGEDRYHQDDVNKYDLDYELVVHNGELLDGYSRASTLIRNGIKYTDAYVSI